MPKIESQVAAHERVATCDGRDHRELYTSHRQHLTDLLLRACPKAGGRLALLGAGNGNDVDLQALLSVFGEVHLVDIDRQAIASARGKLAEDLQPKVFFHAPVDLSGLLNVWEAA